MVSAVITVTYENENGDVSTITKDFTCEVYDNSGELIDLQAWIRDWIRVLKSAVEEDTGMRWWQWAMFWDRLPGRGRRIWRLDVFKDQAEERRG